MTTKKASMIKRAKCGCIIIVILVLYLSTQRKYYIFATYKTEKNSLAVATKTNNTITTASPTAAPLLTCSDIKKLEIVRYIGKGKQKITFDVKLPSGEHALAKRCLSQFCHQGLQIKKEAFLLKGLQEQYGRKETVHFFGECVASDYASVLRMHQEGGDTFDDLALNFSIGFTSVVELGNPLAKEALWSTEVATNKNGHRHMCYIEKRKCFATYFTDADIEGFKTVARQYANYSYTPLVMRQPKRQNTDNCKVEQYILTAAGMRHADLDMVYPCEDCSYEEALEINCSVLRNVIHDESLNCSAVERSTISYPDHHVNGTEAFNQCSKTTERGRILS